LQVRSKRHVLNPERQGGLFLPCAEINVHDLSQDDILDLRPRSRYVRSEIQDPNHSTKSVTGKVSTATELGPCVWQEKNSGKTQNVVEVVVQFTRKEILFQ
jgi:hypothetical protein